MRRSLGFVMWDFPKGEPYRPTLRKGSAHARPKPCTIYRTKATCKAQIPLGLRGRVMAEEVFLGG